MSITLKLELAPIQKTSLRNPVVSRRQSLLRGIDRQLTINEHVMKNGEIPSNPESGRRYTPWFWLDETGKYYLSINYGKKPIELAKGKFSVVCKDLEAVKESLLTIRDSVQKGDFDSLLQSRSHTIRSNFGK